MAPLKQLIRISFLMADVKFPTAIINAKRATKKRYKSFSEVVYTNVKRVIKLEALNEEQAIEKALKREERRRTRNCYLFVDCYYNVVEEKYYEAYRQNYKKIRGRGD